MYSFTTILLALSTSLLTSALPTAPQLAARSCQTTYPTSMTEFTPSETPSNSLTDFCITSTTRVKHAHFDIPAIARGACQLEFVFPVGYSVGGPGSHQVNVWKTERAVQEGDTWETAPKVTTLFGTVTLNSKPNEESRIVVNSGDCKSMADFKFTIADQSSEASVAYQQQYPPAGPEAGMRVVHSC